MLQHIRFSLRTLWRRRIFSIVSILTLGIGIGATSLIFSVVYKFLITSLPFKDPSRLMMILSLNLDPTVDENEYGSSYRDFLDWQERSRAFSSMAAMLPISASFDSGREPEQLDAGRITEDVFPMLGALPQKGRIFTSTEIKQGAKVVILSHSLSRRHFGSADAIGKTVRIDGIGHIIIGVMRKEFFYATETNFWLPLYFEGDLPMRRVRNLYVTARLKDRIQIEQAREDLSRVARQLGQEYPDTNGIWGVKIISLHEHRVRLIRPVLIMLSIAVCILLLITAANVSNMMLTHALERQGEFAVRTALGASRTSLTALLCTENVIISLLGGIAGLICAYWSAQPVLALSPEIALGPNSVKLLSGVTVDLRVVLFGLCLSIFIGLVIGIASSSRIKEDRLHDVLREVGMRTTESRHHQFIRNSLAIAEVSMAVVLLTGAAQMITAFRQLQEIHPGFRKENAITLRISLPETRYASEKDRTSFVDRALLKVRTLPGVKNAAVTTRLPLNEFGFLTGFRIEGEATNQNQLHMAHFRRVSADYFATMGIPILEGREFRPSDRLESTPVAIINQELARRYWKNLSPLGKRLKRPNRADNPWVAIVGVVGNAKESTIDGGAEAVLYFAYTQASFPSVYFVARTQNHPEQILPSLRLVIREIDPQLPVFDVQTLDELTDKSLSKPRFISFLTIFFAVTGVLLAAIGLYGVFSYSVTRRFQEFGIRMALGANSAKILQHILLKATLLALSGIVIGTATALLMMSRIQSVFPNFQINLAVLVLVPVSILTMALLASVIPAFKAIRISPVTALRYN